MPGTPYPRTVNSPLGEIFAPQGGFSGGSDCKESACNVGDTGLFLGGEDPRVGKIPRRREWQLTPVFLSGESHGQRSLAGYSPWGCKESDMSE